MQWALPGIVAAVIVATLYGDLQKWGFTQKIQTAPRPSFLTVLQDTQSHTAEGEVVQVGSLVELTGIEIFDLDDGDTLYFDSSSHRGFAPIRFTVGKGDVIKAFDATSVGRQSGHVVAVSCSADSAFGKSGFFPWHVPPERDLLIYYTPSVVKP